MASADGCLPVQEPSGGSRALMEAPPKKEAKDQQLSSDIRIEIDRFRELGGNQLVVLYIKESLFYQA